MIPSPSDLQYFIEIANTLNLSRAAERLGVSQPSISLSVKRLEDRLGVPLLIRSKGGVNLTRAGQRFVTRARALLHEWEKIGADALREEATLTGRYVIGCHHSVALYTLPHFLPDLMRRHPELELRLVHGLSRQVTDDIIAFKVDFGLVVNPVAHPDLVIKVLAKDEVTLWHGPDREVLRKAEKGEGVLICDPELLQSRSIMKQLAKRPWTFKRTVTSSNLEVITSLVASGAGLGILPGRVATRDPGLGLKAVAQSPRYQDRICLAYRADAQKTQASKMLMQALAGGLS